MGGTGITMVGGTGMVSRTGMVSPQLDYFSMLASHPSYSPPSLVVKAFMRSVVAKTLDCDGTACVSAMHEKVLEPNNLSQIEVGGLR